LTGIVTPEAVRLEFETADVGSRSLALLLDIILQGITLIVVLTAVGGLFDGLSGALPEWVGVVLVVLLVFAVLYVYPVAMETLWRGRTLGKAMIGLRVVTAEGGPVRFRHAAIRGALQFVDLWGTLGGAGFFSILLSSRQQRLGDMVAGTLVLRERTRVAGRYPAAQGSWVGGIGAVKFRLPPGSESYAATIDPSGMTGEDYTAVRSFLLRAATLRSDARTRLAGQLAERIATKMAHTPAPGVSPELFLQIAAARFQQRAQGGAQPTPAPPPPPEAWSQTPPPPAPAPVPPPPTPRRPTWERLPTPEPPREQGGFTPPS
jgi:uncharacterized RDD family membrane protein YckC